MNKTEATKDMSNDELATKIMDVMCKSDLTYDEAIALGDNPHHAAVILEALQATGVIEAYCGPIEPTTCIYKPSGKV